MSAKIVFVLPISAAIFLDETALFYGFAFMLSRNKRRTRSMTSKGFF